MAKPLPNWAIWLHMPKLTTHQAVCLSFGLDPGKVHAYDRRGKNWGWTAYGCFNSIPGFNDRQMLFSACHDKPISARELSKWAQSVGWNIAIELAALSPVPVDAPETLPAEVVHKALVEIAATGASIEELHHELVKLGVTFTMRDGVETVEIPDGTIIGNRAPLSKLYLEVWGLCQAAPAGSKLSSLVRGIGATGTGAPGSAWRPFTTHQKNMPAPANTPQSAPVDDKPIGQATAEPQAEPTDAEANIEKTLTALFDPVPVASLEKMFPADGKWSAWAERASRNGLAEAREGRALFNPYRAALWFLQQGVTGWDLARCNRALANNLPARSRDDRHLLTGELT